MEKIIKEIFTESVMIFGEIKQPKGDRVAPRIYVSTQHIKPKGGLKLNQKYKIIFIPVNETKMNSEEYENYLDKKYPGRFTNKKIRMEKSF